MTTKPRISLVIPVYNEQENIEPLLNEIFSVFGDDPEQFEVILVDDGSTDTTLELVQQQAAKHPMVRWLAFDGNHGQTAAFDAGFRAATGEWVATLDGDLQNDPADILKLLDASDGVDVVCGYRQQRNDNWLRRISSTIANGVRNWLTHEDIIDVGCSARVFRRKYVDELKLFNGMHRFLPTLLKLEGAKVLQIPVNHRPRLHGTAKYGVWNRVFRALRDAFAVRWMQDRYLKYKVDKRG